MIKCVVLFLLIWNDNVLYIKQKMGWQFTLNTNLANAFWCCGQIGCRGQEGHYKSTSIRAATFSLEWYLLNTLKAVEAALMALLHLCDSRCDFSFHSNIVHIKHCFTPLCVVFLPYSCRSFHFYSYDDRKCGKTLQLQDSSKQRMMTDFKWHKTV